MKTGIRFALAAAALAAAGAAFAHSKLQRADPAVGSTVSSASELTLYFDEGVEPKFTSVTVAREGGGAVAVSKPEIVGGDTKVIVVKFGRPLAAGDYSVTWKAVSVDTHHTQGNFDFTIKP